VVAVDGVLERRVLRRVHLVERCADHRDGLATVVPRSPSASGFQDGTGKIAASDRNRRGRYGVTLLQARFAAWGPAAEDLGAGIPPMTDPGPPRWEANTAEPDGREGTERPKIDRDHDRDRTKLAGAWARHSSRGA
jgi:hypothetical protein